MVSHPNSSQSLLASFYDKHIISLHSSKGNINLFTRFTEWEGPHVLYFGDHVYSDLMVRHFHSFAPSSNVCCTCYAEAVLAFEKSYYSQYNKSNSAGSRNTGVFL